MDNKQTQEIYFIESTQPTGDFWVSDGNRAYAKSLGITKEERSLHANLIAEAFNVKAESGKGPKELRGHLEHMKGVKAVLEEKIDTLKSVLVQIVERTRYLDAGVNLPGDKQVAAVWEMADKALEGKYVNPLAERVKELEAGIQYFIDRVEAGTIRSVETYGKYKALLNK